MKRQRPLNIGVFIFLIPFATGKSIVDFFFFLSYIGASGDQKLAGILRRLFRFGLALLRN